MSDVLSALSPVGALVVDLLAVALAFRTFFSASFLRSVLFGFCAGAVALAGLEAVLFQSAAVTAGGFFTYFLGAYALFHLINMGETARRIRLLRELAEAPGGLTGEELAARYNAAEILSRRLKRLIHNRQLIEKDGRLFLGRRYVFWMARAVTMLKTLLLGRRLTID